MNVTGSAWRRIGIVMAGGSGSRFWPVSTPSKPKQFLKLAHPDLSLIEQSYERASRIGEAYIATNKAFAELSAEACGVGPEQVLGEPEKRNTLGCLVWVAASLIDRHPADYQKLSLAVLTADQRISPIEAFLHCADLALTQ
ncbi:MAG: sugar phosphate nucleotidyltransferase, partial [Armatimonadota bacterium]